MELIAVLDVESNFNEYQISLYRGGFAIVEVYKKRGSRIYTQKIKQGSVNFKRALKDARTKAQPGSMAAEKFAEFDRETAAA